MATKKLKYRRLPGYKYELKADYKIQINIFPEKDIKTRHIHLTKDGMLTLKKGFPWEGVSGPMIDTPNTFLGGAVHDACYRLLRRGLIPQSQRKVADKIMYRLFRLEGMSRIRSYIAYRGVRRFGGSSAS